MKKSLSVFLLLSAVGFALFANDTYFYTSGGTLIPQEEKNINVQMLTEVITLKLEKDHYEVNVDFEFFNEGETVDLLVGFPFFETGLGGHGRFYDFKCWTNGELTDYSDMPLIRDFSTNDELSEGLLKNAYARTITFPGRKTTRTRVNYKSEYGRDTSGYIVKYLYGTGRSWSGFIGKMTVIIENNLPESYPNSITLPRKSNFERLADNKWQTVIRDIEPHYTDCITIHTKDIFGDTGPKRFPLQGYKFRDRNVDETELYWFTRPQLRYLRNCIYALHGYSFKSKDLQELFASRGAFWYPPYEPDPDFSESEFTAIEKSNINLLFTEEKARDAAKY